MQNRAMRLALGGSSPAIDPSAYVAPNAVVVGDVRMGAGSSLWYSATLRGDLAAVTLGEGSNVQDSCTLHADPAFPVTVGRGVSIGHNAVVHGCTVEDDCLVGMGAVVLNGAVIGAGSLVAAGAVVSQGMVVPPGSLVAGVPARVKRATTEEEREHIRQNAQAYAGLARAHRAARPVDDRG